MPKVRRCWLMLFVVFSIELAAEESQKVITLAVGHDHVNMVSSNYPIYRANWEFICESLALIGYRVEPIILPWARAKLYTQKGQAHGLFLAANLAGRESWAVLSEPLGYGVFGGFYHKQRANQKELVASVRLGGSDRVLSQYHPKELLSVATAQEGFRLLFRQQIDRLIMSESYGLFLLDTELSEYKDTIGFDSDLIEQRSVHIAFSKEVATSLEALNVVNMAIQIGIEKGLYQRAMQRNAVPKRMQLAH